MAPTRDHHFLDKRAAASASPRRAEIKGDAMVDAVDGECDGRALVSRQEEGQMEEHSVTTCGSFLSNEAREAITQSTFLSSALLG